MRNACVFVVDDVDLQRESLQWLIESRYPCTRGYADPRRFLDEITPEDAGCLVLDLRMPNLNGLEVQERLLATGIDIPIIVVTSYGNIQSAVAAMGNGAFHYLERPLDSETILRKIGEAIALDCERREADRRRRTIHQRFNSLSKREKEVFQLVARGKSSKEVGKLLNLSDRTADSHRSRVKERMQVETLSELIQIAVECNLIDPLDLA